MIVSRQRAGPAMHRPGRMICGETVRGPAGGGFGRRASAPPRAGGRAAAAYRVRLPPVHGGEPLSGAARAARRGAAACLGDVVVYRAEDGSVIARKHVDFAAHPLHPSFELVDRRTGYVEGLAQRDDARILCYHREPGPQSARSARGMPRRAGPPATGAGDPSRGSTSRPRTAAGGHEGRREIAGIRGKGHLGIARRRIQARRRLPHGGLHPVA